MRFGIENRFGITADVHDVTLPWDGIVFGVLRYDSREHQDWLRGEQESNPILRRAMKSVIRQGLDAKVAPEAADGESPAPEVTFQKQFQSALAEAALFEIDKPETDPFAMLGRRSNDRLKEAIALLKFWKKVSDEGGVEVVLTPVTAREFLTSDVHIPDGEHQGKTLGEACVDIIFATSKEHAAQRTALLEGAQSNAEPSSVGS